MNILSLFDGMSCGRIALDRAGVEVGTYYASELDKHAIQVSKDNYPDIVQLGDVTKWKEWDVDWSSIDLLIGGSPCQGFSFAGKQLAFDDPRSVLFFVYIDILNHIKSVNPDVKFLLENVKMKKKFLDVIAKHTKEEPILINSALVSAQNRERLYWSNIPIEQPLCKNATLADILDNSMNNSECVKVKSVASNERVKGVTENERGYRPHRGDSSKSGVGELGRILKTTASKTDTLRTSYAPKLATNNDKADLKYRNLTPLECERLQTVPDDYSSCVSNYQRYKMLGNGWTVDVIAHIFSGL